MNKFFLIIVLFFFNGCKTSDLFKDVKNDFAPEKKTIVHNQSKNKEKVEIPLNGMVFVKENETIFDITASGWWANDTSPVITLLKIKNVFLTSLLRCLCQQSLS